MKFADITLGSYLVWTVPVLIIFYWWALKRERSVMSRFVETDLLPEVVNLYEPKGRKQRAILTIAAVFFVIMAFARPQWGFSWKDNTEKGLDILFAIDTSRSMLALDMSPDRLDFSKAEVADFVRRLKGDRVGLIAFSGQAFLQCPLTSDRAGFLLILNDLSADTVPMGGTSLPAAIQEAVRSYRGAETKNRALIVITDGENTEGDINNAVKEAQKAGIQVSCIGIGTPEGEFIPVMDEKGQRTWVKDKAGNKVRSRLMEGTLKALADSTGGIYVRATRGDFGLDRVYDERLSRMEKKESEERKVKVYHERFQVPLWIALWLIFLSLLTEGRRERS